MPIAPYLTIAGMLFLVMFPVLVPAVISVFHYVTDPDRTSSIQERVVAYLPRRTAPRRLGLAAAAA